MEPHDLIERIGENLTDKEVFIISELGENGPKTGYDFHSRKGRRKNLKMSTATWISAKERLEGKLIRQVKEEQASGSGSAGRNRKYYWLTETGVFKAMQLGASPSKVLNYADQFYPEEATMWSLARNLSKELGEERFSKYIKVVPDIFFTFQRDEWLIKDRIFHKAIGEDIRKIVDVLRKNKAWEQFAEQLVSDIFQHRLGWGITLLKHIIKYSVGIGSKGLILQEESNYNKLVKIAEERKMQSVDELVNSVIIPEWLRERDAP